MMLLMRYRWIEDKEYSNGEDDEDDEVDVVDEVSLDAHLHPSARQVILLDECNHFCLPSAKPYIAQRFSSMSYTCIYMYVCECQLSATVYMPYLLQILY